MKRVLRLLTDPAYAGYLARTAALEADRPFCRHDLAHSLSVARIAYIYALEEGLCRGVGSSADGTGARKPDAVKPILYAAALTHDIGRFRQYEDGAAHEKVSAELAEPLLLRAGFSRAERKEIAQAILLHRDGAGAQKASDSARWIYRADRASRSCRGCAALALCKQPKNGGEEEIV
ncbi:MAG: HD domain-containing protein [Clostridiales bacterium]|jgi:HD superfamily phosphodiesterase|nr:HD domain-containing protein [Clostridiales bacterium]